MPEAAVHETTVAKIVAAQPKIRADVTVVTPDNYDAYATKMLTPPGAESSPADVVVSANPDPEQSAKDETARIEKEKAQRQAKEKEEEIDHPDEKKKSKLTERFSEITKARKEAEAKAEANAKAVAEERAAREAAERGLAALRDKYEPKKTDLGPKPEVSQFSDATEFGKALEDWTREDTLRQESQKQAEDRARKEAEAQSKKWSERVEEAKKDIPDYAETLAASTVTVSDQAIHAIQRSDMGPRIMHHLAKNPEVAANLAKLTVGEMYYEIGQLAATLRGSAKAPVAPKAQVVELSKAPPPISPLTNASAPVLQLGGHQDVPKNMSYEDWKAARQAGRIK